MTFSSPLPVPPPLPCPALADLDRAIANRVQQIHALELELARDLVAVVDMDGCRRLGFSGPGHYGEVRGMGPVSRTLGLLRLGKGLAKLGSSKEAYLDGRITTERAAALCEVAVEADEAQWCERAVRLTTPQFQQDVREELVRRGERAPVRRRVLEIQDKDARALEQAHSQVNRDLGRAVSEGEAIGEISRHYVECRDKRRRRMQTTRTLANDQGKPQPEAIPGARYVPSAVARAVWIRDGGRCRVPGCTFCSFIEMGHIEERRLGGEPTEANLLLLCQTHNMLVEFGLLTLRGTGEAPIFEHPDGRPFGSPQPPDPAHGPSP